MKDEVNGNNNVLYLLRSYRNRGQILELLPNKFMFCKNRSIYPSHDNSRKKKTIFSSIKYTKKNMKYCRSNE